MKKLLLFILTTPMIGFSQITYDDLKYVADSKPKEAIEFIKSKGYILNKTKNSELLTSVRFAKYNPTTKIHDSFISIFFSDNTKNLVTYSNYTNSSIVTDKILNTIKDLGFVYKESNYEDGVCDKYESSKYIFESCEINYSDNDVSKVSYHIRFEGKNMFLSK